MNWQKVKRELKEKYQGKNVLMLPPDNPTEILCEIDPPEKHPEYSVAISVIEKSGEHYHNIISEEYEVIKGEVTLYLNGEKQILKTGDKTTIPPKTKHWAESREGWIKCTATPAWKQEDHVLI